MAMEMIQARRLTWLCYGAMMALAIGLNLLPVFLTTLSRTYGGADGLTAEQLGRLGAIIFAGLVAGIGLTGPLADRYGAKLFVQLGNGLTALSLLAMAFAPTYFTLALALFFLGLAGGMLDMILSPVVSALHPERRAVAMNWLHSFYSVGAVVIILLGTVLLEMGWGWRRACLVMIPLPVFLAIGFAPIQFPALGAVGEERAPLRSLIRHRWFQFALVAIFLGGATELGMAQWLPAYAETALGFPTWVGGTAFLAFSVAMAAGRMTIGALGGRLDSYQLMAWGCGLSIVLFLGASFLPSPSWALAFCILAGFTGSALWPTMLAVTADRFPAGGATMFGALAAVGNAGGIFMPWVVGWVADRSDLHWGLAVSALAPLLMLPLVLALRKGKTV
jgi:fucose permease